jgi:hypothetical protein
MRYLKTYEGLFDFFKKKKSNNEYNDMMDKQSYLKIHLEDVKDCFIDLCSYNSYDLKAFISGGEIQVNIYPLKDKFMKLEDLMETFRFTDSYITDLGLKIIRYELYISGKYDGINYMGDIYYDKIWELEQALDEEGTKHIESLLIRIKKI